MQYQLHAFFARLITSPLDRSAQVLICENPTAHVPSVFSGTNKLSLYHLHIQTGRFHRWRCYLQQLFRRAQSLGRLA